MFGKDAQRAGTRSSEEEMLPHVSDLGEGVSGASWYLWVGYMIQKIIGGKWFKKWKRKNAGEQIGAPRMNMGVMLTGNKEAGSI